MKLSLLLTILFVSSLYLRAESSDFKPDSPESASLFNPALAEQLIVVGFIDQTISRAATLTLNSFYRRRGNYQSSTWSRRTSQQIAEDYNLQKLTEWPMTEVGVQCVVYKVTTVDSIPRIMEQMRRDLRIKLVQKMNLFNTQSHSYNDPYFKLQFNLHAMQIDQVHDKSTGKNITIGMIDTGVDLNHPDLMGQIAHNENFAVAFSSTFASDKHGTAVAGIMVARKDNGTGITGIAPDAKLVAFKACWPDKDDSMIALCNSYTLALAVNTAIKSGIQILNMSLTGPQDPLLELLLNKAIEKGMIVVAADTGLNKGDVNFPASLKDVIPVQTLTRSEAKPTGHNRRVTAPGENVLTTLPHGTYDFISGSSIAAAEVSGIIALLLELKADLTLQEIKSLLSKSELPKKKGLFSGINANDAVTALCETMDCAEKGLSFAWGNY